MSTPDARAGEAYPAQVLAHARQPRFQTPLPAPDAQAEGFNVLCGDRIRVMLSLRGGRIAGYAFHAQACALTVAAASMLGERLPGLDRAGVARLRDDFDALLGGAPAVPPTLGGLAEFAGLARFPARHRCAQLPFATVLAALDGRAHATTEEA